MPKWNYLRCVCPFPSFEVGRFPAYFSYPLERVIKSRYEYLRDVKRLPVQMLPVDDILRFGDNDFANIIAKDDGGTEYASYAMERNGKLKRNTRRGKMRSKGPHNVEP